MTEMHGLRYDSEAELERGLGRLGQELKAASYGSPTWRACVYWIGRTYKEMEDRHRADWGNAFGFMQRDCGDEA